MDSATKRKQPAVQDDSPQGDQEDTGSRTDESSGERINGLMRLVGKRTTEVSEQKARADKAEAALAAVTTRLATYESGASMSAADTDALDADTADSPEVEEQVDDSDSTDGQDFWLPGLPEAHTPSWEPGHTYVDPSSASRVSASMFDRPSATQRLKTDFVRGLDGAIDDWGWTEPISRS